MKRDRKQGKTPFNMPHRRYGAMKDKVKDKICPYCGGRIDKTNDPILIYKCLKCGEWLLYDEVTEKDKRATA